MCISCYKSPITFYSRLFAMLYDGFMAGLEAQTLQAKRERLLSELKGRVLEVGAGTGVNFTFYGSGVEVLAVDPSAEMLSRARRRLASTRADIRLLQAGIGEDRLEEMMPAGGYDAIVCTLVLCTVPEPERIIARLRRWLKDDGQLIVLEHIRSQGGWRSTFYRLINPVWRIFGQGCELIRPTDQYLKKAGFVAEWEAYFHTGLDFYEARLRPKKGDLADGHRSARSYWC